MKKIVKKIKLIHDLLGGVMDIHYVNMMDGFTKEHSGFVKRACIETLLKLKDDFPIYWTRAKYRWIDIYLDQRDNEVVAVDSLLEPILSALIWYDKNFTGGFPVWTPDKREKK